MEEITATELKQRASTTATTSKSSTCGEPHEYEIGQIPKLETDPFWGQVPQPE